MYPKLIVQAVRKALGLPVWPVVVMTWARNSQNVRVLDGAHTRPDHRMGHG